MENGAVYTTTRKQFEESGIRIGGKIAIVEMPEDTLAEIDELEDWIVIEKLLENRVTKDKKGSNKIKAIFFDVDGVFTDGTLANTIDGELTKTFSLRDGMGLEMLRNSGVEVFVMTSENSELVRNRMTKLKLEDNLYLGVKDKYSRIEEVLLKKGYKRNEVAYMGDDINDIANISSVAWGITPQDGVMKIKEVADLILTSKGGEHAIREAVEFILKYNKKF
jgi:N-acylneuraminate cytidylyltransferase